MSFSLPGGFSLRPLGDLEIPWPAADRKWRECLRDLDRNVRGGCVHIVGSSRKFESICVPPGVVAHGDVSQKAGAAALEALSAAIEAECLAQGLILSKEAPAVEPVDASRSADGRVNDEAAKTQGVPSTAAEPGSASPSADKDEAANTQEVPSTVAETGKASLGAEGAVSGEVAKSEVARDTGPTDAGRPPSAFELASQVAPHITVGPGLELVLNTGLPPAFWQPNFLVCVGAGQVDALCATLGDRRLGSRSLAPCTCPTRERYGSLCGSACQPARDHNSGLRNALGRWNLFELRARKLGLV